MDPEHVERPGTPDRPEPATGQPIGPCRPVASVRPPSIGIDTDGGTQAAPGECTIDRVCINTIRTLSMDAVQQAASGHPGTPMALAPVVYTLWQSFLRFDPQDPGWPNRDRFVLSNGHASMLLYSMLHLAGVAPAAAEPRPPRRARGDARRHQELPSARQRLPRPPGIRPHRGRRDDHRAARPGLRDQRRHGDGGALAGASLQPAGRHGVRLRHLRGLRRRRHDGGRDQRSRLARRSSDARQPVLDLRQQPHHDRRPHGSRLQRRRRDALPRLWLERAAGRRRQRHAARRRGDRRLPPDRWRADPDHRREPYRLRRPAQAGYRRRPRRAARGRGSPTGQAQLRVAGRCQIPCSGRRARAFRCRHRSARRAASGRLDGTDGRIPPRPSRTRRGAGADRGRRSSRRLGRRSAGVSAGPQGPGEPRCVRQGAERDRAALPLADRRRGRPRALDEDAADVRERRGFRSRHLRRPQFPFRHPRARDGRGPERARPVGDPRPTAPAS